MLDEDDSPWKHANLMNIAKVVRDYVVKILLGKAAVPSGLREMERYFRLYGPITFDESQDDGLFVARSANFRYGSIVTSGATRQELDTSIRDALLTAFDIPASYAREAALRKVGDARDRQAEYAPA